MTARHKKVKEMTPLKKRALQVGVMAPVSAGFVLAASAAASAACCPYAQQSTQSTQSTQTASQDQTATQSGSGYTTVGGRTEWHGQKDGWQGDWRLDENGQWQGGWTPIGQSQTGQTNQQTQSNQTQQVDQSQNQNQNQQTQQGTKPGNATVGRILQLVNDERAKAGLRPLALNQQLNTAAENYSNQMARTGVYSHTGSDGSSPVDRIKRAGFDASTWAENIHHRTGSPEVIMADWMKSPGHRANILNPNLKDIGIGVDSTGSYWTQDFGA